MTNLPNTYEEFVWNFVSTLPRGFKQLDIDTDTCRENSIKGGQRSTRSSIQKVLIALCKSRLPRDFCLHEEDKTRLIEILSVVMWQFWKSWLLYAVQHHVYLARCYILPHWIWLQSRKNYLQIMRRQTPKWFFTATTQGKGTCRQKLYCVHLPEIPTFLSSLPLSWIPTVLIVIMERGNWENDFGWIKS